MGKVERRKEKVGRRKFGRREANEAGRPVVCLRRGIRRSETAATGRKDHSEAAPNHFFCSSSMKPRSFKASKARLMGRRRGLSCCRPMPYDCFSKVGPTKRSLVPGFLDR